MKKKSCYWLVVLFCFNLLFCHFLFAYDFEFGTIFSNFNFAGLYDKLSKSDILNFPSNDEVHDYYRRHQKTLNDLAEKFLNFKFPPISNVEEKCPDAPQFLTDLRYGIYLMVYGFSGAMSVSNYVEAEKFFLAYMHLFEYLDTYKPLLGRLLQMSYFNIMFSKGMCNLDASISKFPRKEIIIRWLKKRQILLGQKWCESFLFESNVPEACVVQKVLRPFLQQIKSSDNLLKYMSHYRSLYVNGIKIFQNKHKSKKWQETITLCDDINRKICEGLSCRNLVDLIKLYDYYRIEYLQQYCVRLLFEMFSDMNKFRLNDPKKVWVEYINGSICIIPQKGGMRFSVEFEDLPECMFGKNLFVKLQSGGRVR